MSNPCLLLHSAFFPLKVMMREIMLSLAVLQSFPMTTLLKGSIPLDILPLLQPLLKGQPNGAAPAAALLHQEKKKATWRRFVFCIKNTISATSMQIRNGIQEVPIMWICGDLYTDPQDCIYTCRSNFCCLTQIQLIIFVSGVQYLLPLHQGVLLETPDPLLRNMQNEAVYHGYTCRFNQRRVGKRSTQSCPLPNTYVKGVMEQKWRVIIPVFRKKHAI